MKNISFTGCLRNITTLSEKELDSAISLLSKTSKLRISSNLLSELAITTIKNNLTNKPMATTDKLIL